MEKSNKKILIAIVAVVVIAVVAVVLFVALKPSYKSQIKAFGKAMTDSEKMEEFVEKKVNLIALYAIEKLEEHDDLDTGDEDAVKKAFEEEYKKAKKSDYEGKEFVDEVKTIYAFMTALTAGDDDVKVEVKDIGKLEDYDEYSFLKKAKFTLKLSKDDESEDVELIALFYKGKIVMVTAE